MKIEELKLDFKDVLIRPKRSEAKSRKDVSLERNYTFRNGSTWQGIPIVAANMDGVGTFEMSGALMKEGLLTCLVKSYELKDYLKDEWLWTSERSIISTGITEADLYKTQKIINTLGSGIKFVCIDVANGYSEHFVKFVRSFREKNPQLTIIAGNVVTADMTQELILAGADIVKVGIGPGCFAAGTLVNTAHGLKPIEEIKIGDEVFTHMNRIRKVSKTFIHEEKKSFVEINGIKATPNHEFYVVHKKYQNILNDNNIHDYAQWISAEEITQEYFLLELK